MVESLEAGDFECGDWVTFFTQVTVDAGAASSGTIELDYTFGAETTGQPGLGFDDIISVAINTPDGGNVGNVANNVVTLSNESIETQGYDQVHGTVDDHEPRSRRDRDRPPDRRARVPPGAEPDREHPERDRDRPRDVSRERQRSRSDSRPFR